MTKQEIFDKVWKHALQMPRLARNRDGFCVYRTPSGNCCLIGALIPQKLYRDTMEASGSIAGNKSVRTVLKKVGVNCSSPTTIAFLEQIQDCHDSATSKAQMLSYLREAAHDESLSIPT